MITIGITSAVLERLAGSLLHFVWQGTVIAIVTALALLALRRRLLSSVRAAAQE